MMLAEVTVPVIVLVIPLLICAAMAVTTITILVTDWIGHRWLDPWLRNRLGLPAPDPGPSEPAEVPAPRSLLGEPAIPDPGR